MKAPKLRNELAVPSRFRFDQVASLQAKVKVKAPVTPAPSLGPLAAFTGNFSGNGFNTIFRPDSAVTPTPLPIPAGGDNVLELNLTQETLSFGASLGSVPNRGTGPQADAFLNGVPYLQTISDITTRGESVGIHFEPGMWIIVPTTTNPAEGVSLCRMASIPHGTTIAAQGTFTTIAGKPTIPPVDITPFGRGGGGLVRFPSQTAANNATARIPQDLSSPTLSGPITQTMLDDPNSVLRDHIASQKIISTTIITIATGPAAPLFGGGTDNIAFLRGDPTGTNSNADSISMTATFWIETVEIVIIVPPFEAGAPPLTLPGDPGHPALPAPRFLLNPPFPIPRPHPIKIHMTQIQYSQTVNLNFAPLTWPHVSVATLVPTDPVPVPPSVWT